MVGAGVIGTEYASIFQALGVDVHLVDGRTQVLGFLDTEMHDHLLAELRERGMHTHLGESVTACTASGGEVEVTTKSGTVLRADALLFSGGRLANTDDLGLEAIGVTLDLPAGKLYFTGGTGGRVGMANLDGTDLVDLVTGTAGLTGIALAVLP